MAEFTASSAWKSFVRGFRAEFLEPREEICKGYRHFLSEGDRLAWDQGIQQMFTQYPDAWAMARFPGKQGKRDRFQSGHDFLVAQTKKLRATRRAGEEPARATAKSSARRTKHRRARSTNRRARTERIDYPMLEFPTFICVVRYEKVPELIDYQSVREFSALVAWVRREFQLSGDIAIHVPTVVVDEMLLELLQHDPDDIDEADEDLYSEPTLNVAAYNQATWNVAVMNAQYNRNPMRARFDYMSVAVSRLAPGEKGRIAIRGPKELEKSQVEEEFGVEEESEGDDQ